MIIMIITMIIIILIMLVVILTLILILIVTVMVIVIVIARSGERLWIRDAPMKYKRACKLSWTFISALK